jgi:hypothetical protein
MIGVSDPLTAGYCLLFIIEFYCYLIVGFLLPIVWSWGTGSSAVFIWRRQNLFELFEFSLPLRLFLRLRQDGNACQEKKEYVFHGNSLK